MLILYIERVTSHSKKVKATNLKPDLAVYQAASFVRVFHLIFVYFLRVRENPCFKF